MVLGLNDVLSALADSQCSTLYCRSAAEQSEIVTDRLPGYVPETNPDCERVANIRYSRVANVASEDTREPRKATIEHLNSLIVAPDFSRFSSAMPESPSDYSGCLVRGAGNSK